MVEALYRVRKSEAECVHSCAAPKWSDWAFYVEGAELAACTSPSALVGTRPKG